MDGSRGFPGIGNPSPPLCSMRGPGRVPSTLCWVGFAGAGTPVGPGSAGGGNYLAPLLGKDDDLKGKLEEEDTNDCRPGLLLGSGRAAAGCYKIRPEFLLTTSMQDMLLVVSRGAGLNWGGNGMAAF